MTLEIEGVDYVTSAELIRELKVSRQTLWRWRQEGKIPSGLRFRDRQLVFTAVEARAIREYANRLEPAGEPGGNGQLGLFGEGRRGV